MINTATRAQSTSTMGSIAHPGPYGDHNATMSRDRKKEFSTAVAYEGIDQDVMNGLFAAAHDFAQVEDMHVFGKELTLSEAVAAVRSGENHFDKIVLLVSHGEAACVSEEEALATFGNKRVGEIALTSHVSNPLLILSFGSKETFFSHTNNASLFKNRVLAKH